MGSAPNLGPGLSLLSGVFFYALTFAADLRMGSFFQSYSPRSGADRGAVSSSTAGGTSNGNAGRDTNTSRTSVVELPPDEQRAVYVVFFMITPWLLKRRYTVRCSAASVILERDGIVIDGRGLTLP